MNSVNTDIKIVGNHWRRYLNKHILSSASVKYPFKRRSPCTLTRDKTYDVISHRKRQSPWFFEPQDLIKNPPELRVKIYDCVRSRMFLSYASRVAEDSCAIFHSPVAVC